MQILVSVGIWEPTPYGYREMTVPSCEALGEPKKSGVGGRVLGQVYVRNRARVTAGGTFKKLVYSPILETIQTHLQQDIGVEGEKPEDYLEGSWKGWVNGWQSRHLHEGGFLE